MLEQQQAQLVTGLQELYKRMQNGESWPGSPLKESSNGHPLTHDILERLGALKVKHDSNNFSNNTNNNNNNEETHFEDDLTFLQQRLFAGGATLLQRQDSSDGGSDSEHSPVFPSKQMLFNDSMAANNHFPPTPPNYSPFPRPQRLHHNHHAPARNAAARYRQSTANHSQQRRPQPQPHCTPPNPPRIIFPNQPSAASNNNNTAAATTTAVASVAVSQTQPALNPSLLQQQQHQNQNQQPQPQPSSWPHIAGADTSFEDNLEFLRRFEPGTSIDTLEGLQHTSTGHARPLPLTGLNSCLPMRQDWDDDMEFKTFFNPSPPSIM